MWGVQERYGVGEQRCGDDGVTAAAAGAVPFGGEACGSSVQAAGLAWLAQPTVCASGSTLANRGASRSVVFAGAGAIRRGSLACSMMLWHSWI